MTQAPALSSELTRQAVTLARALSAATRSWGLYPPEHPTAAAAIKRLSAAVNHATAGAVFTLGVTPDTLLVAGQPLPDEQPVRDAARLLHDHDVLHLTFLGEPERLTLHALLTLLLTPADELRAQGGPAAAWQLANHPAVAIEQIDYERILEDRDVELTTDRHDDVWRAVVNSIVEGRHTFDVTQQERLLEIAGNAADIGDLSAAVMAPKCSIDGSPLITTQAATVLATFRHLARIVTVMNPDGLPDVMRSIAAAATSLDPHVVMQIMQSDESLHDTPIITSLAQSFDDDTVAQLLATALGRDGRATARLAQVFDTIAPDAERKQRVLRMARHLLSEADFGRSGQFKAIWNSMEELLLTYDESPYVSAAYQASLEGAAGRGDMFAALAQPAELAEWVESLGQDNVRTLSVLLLTDLLRIEDHDARAAEIAGDMTVLVDDLLLSGDFPNAALVLRELRAASQGTVAPAAMRAALGTVGESDALRDAASLLGDLDDTMLAHVVASIESIGPIAVRGLSPALQCEAETLGYTRARELTHRFGPAAVPHLAPLVDDARWFVQRNAASLLGATRSPDAVPALQGLLRHEDTRVLRQAVSALAGIDDPAAARAVQMALRTVSVTARTAVMEALVEQRDPRVVPMLARILVDCDPFGEDHATVLDALSAVRQLADDRAVPAVVTVMRRRRFFAGGKARALKAASVRALRAMGTAKASAALRDASQTGDRLLKRILRERRGEA